MSIPVRSRTRVSEKVKKKYVKIQLFLEISFTGTMPFSNDLNEWVQDRRFGHTSKGRLFQSSSIKPILFGPIQSQSSSNAEGFDLGLQGTHTFSFFLQIRSSGRTAEGKTIRKEFSAALWGSGLVRLSHPLLYKAYGCQFKVNTRLRELSHMASMRDHAT